MHSHGKSEVRFDADIVSKYSQTVAGERLLTLYNLV